MPKSHPAKSTRVSKRILDIIKEHGDKILDFLPLPAVSAAAGQRRRRPRKRITDPTIRRNLRQQRRTNRGINKRLGRRLPGNTTNTAPAVANFATPASFARVENNTMFLGAERPVVHPTLGVHGTCVTFNQPLVTANVGWYNFNGTTYSDSFFEDTGPAITWPLIDLGALGGSQSTFIDINPGPMGFNGPLATVASRFEKFRFTKLVVTYTTAVGTNQQGTFGMAITEDPAMVETVTRRGFNSVREIVPNVIAPYRIPEATLAWECQNTTLYYINDVNYTAIDEVAQSDARQVFQGVIAAFDSGILTTIGAPGSEYTTCGYFTVSGECEFYEPIPPTAVPESFSERKAVSDLLNQMRGISLVPKRPTMDQRRIAEDEQHKHPRRAKLSLQALQHEPVPVRSNCVVPTKSQDSATSTEVFDAPWAMRSSSRKG